jgi:hypothetical protein
VAGSIAARVRLAKAGERRYLVGDERVRSNGLRRSGALTHDVAGLICYAAAAIRAAARLENLLIPSSSP